MQERERYLSFLVDVEGVTEAEASDFLDVLDLARDEDEDFHARFMAELDGRILIREAQSEARRGAVAHAALVRVSVARDTRVGPSDVRTLTDAARRASA